MNYNQFNHGRFYSKLILQALIYGFLKNPALHRIYLKFGQCSRKNCLAIVRVLYSHHAHKCGYLCSQLFFLCQGPWLSSSPNIIVYGGSNYGVNASLISSVRNLSFQINYRSTKCTVIKTMILPTFILPQYSHKVWTTMIKKFLNKINSV